MANESMSNLLPGVVMAVPAIGLAIFEIRKGLYRNFRWETKAAGRGSVRAFADKSDSENIYLFVPTGSEVSLFDGGRQIVEVSDMSEKPAKNLPGNVVFRGDGTARTTVMDANIVEVVPGISARYFGSLYNAGHVPGDLELYFTGEKTPAQRKS